MDIITPEARSRNMSRIKSKNTKAEITLRKSLYKQGLRYRIHYKLPGKPDLVFKSKKLAVFMHGCFWHGHGCKNDHTPKTNSNFWNNKIVANKERDARNIERLKVMEWKTIVVWECEIEKNIGSVIDYIISEVGYE